MKPRPENGLAPHVAESLAEQLADREIFRARADLLLVELQVAARRIAGGESSLIVARRALELLVEKAVTPVG